MDENSKHQSTYSCMLLCIVTLPVFLNGCILPIPHFKKTSGPLCGYIVTHDPNVPVTNAHILVSYPDGGFRETTTNEQGYFSFPKKIRFHWGVMIGIALNYSLPYDMYINTYSELTVNADGFNERYIFPEYYKEVFGNDPNAFYSDLTDCPEIPIH